MLCLITYQHKSLEDFETWEEWCNFVNENYKFGSTKSKVWDWKDKCKDSDLPSYHPYWSLLVFEETQKSLKWTEERYEECLENYEKIKYYFSGNDSYDTIREKINKYKNNTQSLEKRIRY